METRASYILVGSFVLALIAGLFGFAVWVAKIQLEESRQPYRIYFTGSVTGLQTGSPVRYQGIPIGTVTDLRLDPENVSRVRVTIEVNADTPIKTDSIASLEVQGVTGGAYVQIAGGTPESKLLRETEHKGVPVIPSRPSTLATVVDAAPQILARVLDLTDRLSAGLMSPENLQALTQTLDNARRVSGDVAAATQGLDGTVRELTGLLAELNRTAQTVGPHLDQTVVQAGRSMQTVTADLHELTGSLKQASAQLNAMVTENRQPVRDFAQTGLYEITLLVTQLRDLSAQIGRVVGRIENDPSNFLFGGTRNGVEIRGR
ncbi:MlaD family protein [Azospirillum sp. TSO22-1]|uniref:MlaD family protein n=1 Tax=Azospirillum sp. TSO22-1 TaxID=716789 RepID=UPI000D617C34|nr:MlaD family protein [Azospirillum sp. TSO22-1]PWC52347.1 ABC transporter substrate-binding protein [Azospirillum sp. TSO22-1]